MRARGLASGAGIFTDWRGASGARGLPGEVGEMWRFGEIPAAVDAGRGGVNEAHSRAGGFVRWGKCCSRSWRRAAGASAAPRLKGALWERRVARRAQLMPDGSDSIRVPVGATGQRCRYRTPDRTFLPHGFVSLKRWRVSCRPQRVHPVVVSGSAANWDGRVAARRAPA